MQIRKETFTYRPIFPPRPVCSMHKWQLKSVLIQTTLFSEASSDDGHSCNRRRSSPAPPFMGPSRVSFGPPRLNVSGGPCWVNGVQQVNTEKTGNLNTGDVRARPLVTRSALTPTHFCRSPVNKLGSY